MSYSELWDCFAKVKSNWDDSKNLIYYFIELIYHKVLIEQEYASGLQRLTRAAIFNRGKNTIMPSLKHLMTIFSQQSHNLLQLIDHQQSDLIPALKSLLTQQDETIKAKVRQGKDLEYELQRQTSAIEKAKNYYFSYCASSAAPTKREESAAKAYLKLVEDGNAFLLQYEPNMKEVLQSFQVQEMEKLSCLKDSFRKLAIYEMSYMRSVQYELERFPTFIDAFNPEIEITKFVDDSASGNKLRQFIFENHPKRIQCEPILSQMSERKMLEVVDIVIEKCWKGVLINNEDNKLILEILNHHEGRKLFMQKLNNRKVLEELMLPSYTFGVLCGISSKLLDKVQEFQDISCARQVLFLSQFFFEETLSHRTFLHQVLLTHSLWEDTKIWSNLIITAIDMEMENDAKLCEEDSGSLSQTIKLQPVMNNKVENYLQQMNNFMVDRTIIKKTLKSIQDYYSFTVDVSVILKNLI